MCGISEGLAHLVRNGFAPCLVNDDNGMWTVLFDGFQPAEGGPGSYCWFVEEETQWHKTPDEAIAQAIAMVFPE